MDVIDGFYSRALCFGLQVVLVMTSVFLVEWRREIVDRSKSPPLSPQTPGTTSFFLLLGKIDQRDLMMRSLSQQGNQGFPRDSVWSVIVGLNVALKGPTIRWEQILSLSLNPRAHIAEWRSLVGRGIAIWWTENLFWSCHLIFLHCFHFLV
jgi:hypothetical protein